MPTPPKPQHYYKNRERFQVVSGQVNPPHGEIMYGVITGQGDGTLMYRDGREVTVAKQRSLEFLGENINVSGVSTFSSTASENGINPAKWIRADKGDIVLEAPNGKIILAAEQIEITANGNQILDKTGNIHIKANSSVNIGAPSIQIKGSKTSISGSHTLTLIGQNYLNTIGGFHNSTVAGDALNPCGGIVSKASGILNTIQLILS